MSSSAPTQPLEKSLPFVREMFPVSTDSRLEDVKTGEEDETTIFEIRARLFEFGEKEWKERGVGVFKINTMDTGKTRIVWISLFARHSHNRSCVQKS